MSGRAEITGASQSSGYLNSIDSVAVRRLLGSFPTTSLSARSIDAKDWKDSLFATNVRDDATYVTVPKNVEAFQGNLLFISILKIFEIKGWIPTLSEKELPSAVLTTNDGHFYAGFVAQSLRRQTGPLNTGTQKFDKGARAHQLYSVEKAHKNQTHLRQGGVDKLTKKLSDMRSFTQAYWGLRGTIASLFKSVPTSSVTDLHTYIKPKPELMKVIKSKFAYQNGGLFRPEEIAYFDVRYHNEKERLDEFVALLDQPTETLARDFQALYSRVRAGIARADHEVQNVATQRARLCFPAGNKPKDKKFAKKSLTEKILSFREEQKIQFKPESLPGIVYMNSSSGANVGSEAWLVAFYGEDPGETAREIILSWYSNFVPSEEED